MSKIPLSVNIFKDYRFLRVALTKCRKSLQIRFVLDKPKIRLWLINLMENQFTYSDLNSRLGSFMNLKSFLCLLSISQTKYYEHALAANFAVDFDRKERIVWLSVRSRTEPAKKIVILSQRNVRRSHVKAWVNGNQMFIL